VGADPGDPPNHEHRHGRDRQTSISSGRICNPASQLARGSNARNQPRDPELAMMSGFTYARMMPSELNRDLAFGRSNRAVRIETPSSIRQASTHRQDRLTRRACKIPSVVPAPSQAIRHGVPLSHRVHRSLPLLASSAANSKTDKNENANTVSGSAICIRNMSRLHDNPAHVMQTINRTRLRRYRETAALSLKCVCNCSTNFVVRWQFSGGVTPPRPGTSSARARFTSHEYFQEKLPPVFR